MVFDDELMGQLIRFVSSHTLKYTLGLRHNFGSSSTVIPVEKTERQAWVEANGHTPSIMDYKGFQLYSSPKTILLKRSVPLQALVIMINGRLVGISRWYPEAKQPMMRWLCLIKLPLTNLKPEIMVGRWQKDIMMTPEARLRIWEIIQ